MTTDAVLLVTSSYDPAARLVEQALERMSIPFFRLDTDRFPSDVVARFSPECGLEIGDGGRGLKSQDVHSVWYRRNVKPFLPVDLDPGYRDFCERESRAFLVGCLLTLPTARWMSFPDAVWKAEHKPYQLPVASQLGFSLPETVITNCASAVRELGVDHDIIAKAVSSGYVLTEKGNGAIFTSVVSEDDVLDLGGLELSPVIFQRLQEKKSDIRVTVVGDEVFTAEILSQERDSSRTDWRATDDPFLEHRVHELPSDVSQRCRDLVQRLGLSFGAIDLALNHDGSYVFFEINPNGEWVWLEEQLGLPISSSIAKWLAS